MDSAQIEELAGQWLARRDGAQWSEQDEAEFQAWLNESTAHTVAFVRLEAAWKQAKRLKALSGDVAPGRVPSTTSWHTASFFEGPTTAEQRPEPIASRNRRPFYLIAASILVAVIGIVWYLRPSVAEYSTPVGGLASVPMLDGSRVTLNTNSQVRVRVSQQERRVELRQGEAYFEVAKDAQRPFTVIVGERRVIAVGTAFSVRRDGQDVRVAVTEGRVGIKDAAARGGDGEAKKDMFTIAAGNTVRVTNAGLLVQEASIAEIERELSWRTGYLIFSDARLTDVIAEFNRYNLQRVFIADPSVAELRVSGKFRSDQFHAFVRLLEQGFPVQVQTADGRIVLNYDRSAAPAPPK